MQQGGPSRVNTHLNRIVALVVVVAATFVASGVAPDRVDAQPTPDYEVSIPSWGSVSIAGDFDQAVAKVPGTDLVVANLFVGESFQTRRLVTVDVTTLEVVEGPIVDLEILRLVVSPSANWLYILTEGDISDAYDGRIHRYSLPEMTPAGVIETSESEFVGGRQHIDSVHTVPSDDDLLIVRGDSTVQVFAGLVALPDTLQAFRVDDVVAIDDHLALVRSGAEVSRATLGPTGLADGGVAITAADWDGFADRFDLFGDSLRFGDRLYQLPELSLSVVATPSQRTGVLDAELGVVYASRGELGTFGPILSIFALDGIELTHGEGDVFVSNETLLGRGWVVQTAGTGLRLSDVPRIIGGAGEFHALQPIRLFDSRDGTGRDGIVGPIGPDSTTRVPIQGVESLPQFGVEAVVLNVTAIVPSAASFVSVFPAGASRPVVSNLNFGPSDVVIGNMVTVGTGVDGAVDVYQRAGAVDITVDVLGYFGSALSAPGARYVSFHGGDLPIDPFSDSSPRLLDTRLGQGAIGPDERIRLNIPQPFSSQGSRLPASAIEGVVLNVAAVDPTAGSHLQVFAAGGPLPSASSMNFLPGKNTARLLTADLDDNGQIEIYNKAGFTDLVVDLVGVYVTERAQHRGRFVGITPERVVDTREDSPFPDDGRLRADSILVLPGFRAGLSLATNVAAVDARQAGYLTASHFRDAPSVVGANRHFTETSTLNYAPGQTVANQALVNVAGGEIGVYDRSGGTHVIVDLFGYYTGFDG